MSGSGDIDVGTDLASDIVTIYAVAWRATTSKEAGDDTVYGYDEKEGCCGGARGLG